jgi:hypothetical protein
MSDPFDWIARSGAKAKGRRPDFLGNTNEERMLSMLMALIAEVSVVRERLDTVERLLEEKGAISRADIEHFAPDLETGKERNRIVREYLARVLRGLQQELEATANPEPAIEDIVTELTQ